MNPLFALGRRTRQVVCRVDVEHTFDSLHAYVELPDDVAIGPGDEVRVEGAPVAVAYGEQLVLERRAIVVQAGWLERLWTRLVGRFEYMELLEFSFSTWRRL